MDNTTKRYNLRGQLVEFESRSGATMQPEITGADYGELPDRGVLSLKTHIVKDLWREFLSGILRDSLKEAVTDENLASFATYGENGIKYKGIPIGTWTTKWPDLENRAYTITLLFQPY